jgi:hypothetical protein
MRAPEFTAFRPCGRFRYAFNGSERKAAGLSQVVSENATK